MNFTAIGNGDYRAAHLACKYEWMGSWTQISGEQGDHFIPIQTTILYVLSHQ